MNIKELLAHVNENIQNDRKAGFGLTYCGVASSIALVVETIEWHEPHQYELTPKMVLINGIGCVAGMTEAPKDGVKYFRPAPFLDSGLHNLGCMWSGSALNYQLLAHGMVFERTQRGEFYANEMGKAMTNFGGVE